jgi:hypothetical protein
MKYTEQQFNDLVTRFNSLELPKEAWTHHAHILVAFWHVWRYDESDSLMKVRRAIRAHNDAVGTINSENSGYHETLTVFWLKVVRYFFSLKTSWPLIDAINSFIEAGHADKNLPLQFYSNELLFSKDARLDWVDPDKLPLNMLDEVVRRPIPS